METTAKFHMHKSKPVRSRGLTIGYMHGKLAAISFVAISFMSLPNTKNEVVKILRVFSNVLGKAIKGRKRLQMLWSDVTMQEYIRAYEDLKREAENNCLFLIRNIIQK